LSGNSPDAWPAKLAANWESLTYTNGCVFRKLVSDAASPGVVDGLANTGTN